MHTHYNNEAFAASDSSLSVESTKISRGFPVNVTATADGDAWVGVYPTDWIDDPMTFNYNSTSKAEGGNDGYMSVYWYYVKEHYGTSFNIKSGRNNLSGSKVSPYSGLPEGEYYIVLFDSTGGYTPEKYVKIQVVPSTAGSEELSLKTEGGKTDFGPGEPVNVIATGPEGAWVGLYPADQTTYTGNLPSISWYWVSDANGAPYDIKGSIYLTTGQYKIILFSDDGYTISGDPIVVTIRDVDTSGTVFDLKLSEGTNYGGGYRDTESVLVTVTAKGETGNSWVGIYPGALDKNSDFSTQRSIYWYYVRDFNGVSVDPVTTATVNPDRNEYFGLPNGDYTVVVFGDGGYENVRQAVNFRKDKSISSIAVVKEPTCRTMGKRVIYYEDGTTSDDIDPSSGLIPALGHDWGAYSYNADTRTHTAVCNRNSSHTKTESCTFGEGVLTTKVTASATGVLIYTCTVCGGSYTEAYYPAVGETYKSGKARYQVTSSDEVRYIECLSSSTVKTVTVPDTIKLAGRDYKVTSVKSGSFASQTQAKVKLGKYVKTAPKKVTYKAGSAATLAAYRITGTSTATYYCCLASKSLKALKIPATVKLGGTSYKVTVVRGKAFNGYNKVNKVTVGKNVTKLKARCFYGAKKLTAVVLKTKGLKKANVANSLKGSKVKTIKVSLGNSTDNKTYIKKYKKIFAKSNSGKAVTLK